MDLFLSWNYAWLAVRGHLTNKLQRRLLVFMTTRFGSSNNETGRETLIASRTGKHKIISESLVLHSAC